MIILDAEEKKKKAESKKQKKYIKKRDTGKRLLPTGGLPIRDIFRTANWQFSQNINVIKHLQQTRLVFNSFPTCIAQCLKYKPNFKNQEKSLSSILDLSNFTES
ncbi:hypothetical protein OUZ56_001580 [Daphnia magna]|uniref:Uncharacterized protein n=1 Tax=Daphnia magna TaxID=35525 RepID=A0ABR0A337_9CRUS|nr:hypothetical protein OUZ56_001580 [Daphnia magna]